MITEKRNNTKQKYYSKRDTSLIAYIKYQLEKNGYTQTDIAHDIGISRQGVSLSISGLTKISRVDEWLKDNINLDVNNLQKIK